MIRMLLQCLEWLGVFLYRVGLASFVIGLRPRAARVLLYHACEPGEDEFLLGLRSNVPPARFEEHMRFVRRFYNAVSVDALAGADRPPRTAVITFDDGYRSVLTGAAPILRTEGLPFAVYVVSEVVGNHALVWVNALNWLLQRHAAHVTPMVREAVGGSDSDAPAVLVDLVRARLSPDAIDALLESASAKMGLDVARLAGDRRLYLEWDDVHHLHASGATIGNHTASHFSLPRLDPASVRSELQLAHDTIVRAIGSCDSFAHPFGDVAEEARRWAVGMEYKSVMCVSGPQHPLRTDVVSRVPALDVPVDRLFATIEIVEPAKAMVRTLQRSIRRS